CLHPQGEEMALESLFKDANDEKSRGLVFVIGGFSEGDYKSPVKKHVDSTVSIYPGVLKVWTVASEIIAGYERAMGLV
ncbi:MAG: hypothetical protein QCI38_07385, partial [Candidatus Thermoplasmatota archaeon]|nr:hypothetical protein [Candidatus Thermoplasmatota archaeon]